MKNSLLFLASLFLLAAGEKDGSSPEEICPCQKEDTCEDPRHIYGTDPLDIEHFGLIPPCKDFRMGIISCCPKKPPPPKEIKLSAQELQSLSPEELLVLRDLNGGPGAGTGTLPLSLPTNLKSLPPVAQANLRKPGALSLPPAETAKSALSKVPSAASSVKAPYSTGYPSTYPSYATNYYAPQVPTYPPPYPPPKATYPAAYASAYAAAYPPAYPPYPRYQPLVYPSVFQAAKPVLGMYPTFQLLTPLSIFRPRTPTLFKWKKF